MREPVRFADGVGCLADQGVTSFLELGPDGVLSAMVARRARRRRWPSPLLRRVSAPRHGRSSRRWRQLWGRAAEALDWSAVFAGSRRTARDAARPYAFQRERYWLASDGLAAGDPAAIGQAARRASAAGCGGRARRAARASLFTGRLSLRTQPWLADHTVMGGVLVPGTALVELALYAGGQVGCERAA